MRTQNLQSDFFSRNRKNLTRQLEKGTMALAFSNPIAMRNGDQQYVYRQDSDMFYLTGITQMESVLLLYCEKNSWNEILFITKPDPKTAIWDGEQLSKSRASEISGINEVRYTESLKVTLLELAPKTNALAVSRPLHHIIAGKWVDSVLEINDQINLTDLKPKIARLRVIKSSEEIKCIKESVRITHEAFNNLIKIIKPGKKEYEIEAEMIRTFLSNGADGHAFDPIVASGINSCTLHYIDNTKKMEDGDILLLDFGAEKNGYAADMSRTLPVNGKFSARQAEVYNAVLRTQKKTVKIIKPGISIKEINKQVRIWMEKEMIQLGLITQKDIDNQDPDEPISKKYFMHGTCHFMGLDVHDVGDPIKPLEPGMVITCEPGIYIKEEKIGVRIENDILITENGNEDLMNGIPREIEEIELLMNQNHAK
ncbi:MAG: X-Pro aminopeptidase [Salinivirgaceae bacterium]|nr:MAG: X-Pro aminopeptidase [Salinivirgaceae bacterium]